MYIRKLTEKYKKVVLMRIQNISYEEIKTETGLSFSTINKIISDPLAKEYKQQILQERLDNAKSILINNAINAAETIKNGCTDKETTLTNIRAAELNLKYIGLEPVKKIEAEQKITIIDNIPDVEDDKNGD